MGFFSNFKRKPKISKFFVKGEWIPGYRTSYHMDCLTVRDPRVLNSKAVHLADCPGAAHPWSTSVSVSRAAHLEEYLRVMGPESLGSKTVCMAGC